MVVVLILVVLERVIPISGWGHTPYQAVLILVVLERVIPEVIAIIKWQYWS